MVTKQLLSGEVSTVLVKKLCGETCPKLTVCTFLDMAGVSLA